MQTTIFDMLYPKYKITKPIRLIEFFAGYGSQALALKYLGVEFEHWRICEWAVKSIQAYKDIHFTDDNEDYSIGISREYCIDWLYQFGISNNYNEPMTKQQISRLSTENLFKIRNNIYATNNLVNIQNVKGKDLEIVDTDKYEYILTYSFPCQDLSLAGKGKGMSDTSTRSGMLWEVERILKECKELGELPQILLMENVPQVHGTDNVEDFNKWQLELEKLGYKNYFQDLIATDYGIPQTRNRCFMISILGDYSYTFPQPIPLKLKLKDMLEQNVDEKYFLSDAMIKCFTRETEDDKFPRGDRFKQALKLTNEKNLAVTITTAAGNRATDNFILTKDTENYIEWEDGKNIQMNCRAWKDDKVVATLNTGGETKILTNKSLQKTLEQNKIDDTCYIDTYNKRIDKEKSGTITTGVSFRNNTFLAIKNATKKGYLEAKDGDGIDLAQPNSETRRGRVQKKAIQTLTTQNNLGVVTIGNYSPSNHNASRIVDKDHSAPTVMENHGTITAIIDNHNKKAKHQQDMVQDCNGNARTLVCGTHGNGGHYTKTMMSDLRIRKLTPKECFRLMGVKDEDFEKVSKNQSDSSLYHLAGDSIVVNVLMAIFKELL